MKSLNNLRAKLKKQGGFTLIEMLIVVAIIGILVAVSIPAVNSSLDKAKEATDKANARAAFGLGMINYLNDGKLMSTDTDDTVYYAVSGEGQGAFVDSDSGADIYKGQSSAYKNQKIKVSIVDEKVTVSWE